MEERDDVTSESGAAAGEPRSEEGGAAGAGDEQAGPGAAQAGATAGQAGAEAGNGQAAAEQAGAAHAADETDPEALREALEAERRRAAEYKDELLRAQAELENTRRRAARDVEKAHKYGLDRLINEFLPVKDSMELGLSASLEGQDVAAVREGLELTLKMFGDALERLGVSAIDPQGEKFDPEYHQAMNTVPAADKPPGTVVSVMQKGYVLNDRLVRPALVSVSKAPESSEGQGGRGD